MPIYHKNSQKISTITYFSNFIILNFFCKSKKHKKSLRNLMFEGKLLYKNSQFNPINL